MAAISIVVPVYKALRRCVDSLLGQTLRDIELILVDDGSPDGCPAICDEYAARDGRVRVIHKENGGPVSARKAGIAASTAPFVGFADSDDWAEPRFYEDLYQGIVQTGADAVDAEVWTETDPPTVRVRENRIVYEGEEGIRHLVRQLFLNCLVRDPARWHVSYALWDKLFRRQLLLDNMPFFNERIILDEDRLANAVLLADCRKMVSLSHTAKYHYCLTDGSVSSSVSEDRASTLEEYIRTLLAIAQAKGLEREPVDIFIGDTVYRWLYRASAQPDTPFREKCACIRRQLPCVPPGALDKYARARGGLAIRLFCAMLRWGFAAPCVLLITLHAALTGYKN